MEPATLQFINLLTLMMFMWCVVGLLHWARFRVTLVPLYGLISALVVYTHTLSSLGVSVIFFDLFFLVSSNAYFTPLLVGILFIYLFDGVEAARKGLEILILVSVMQVIVVFTSGSIDNQNLFIPATTDNFKNYFWSILAMITDVVAMSIVWEYLAKTKLNQFLKVFILLFIVLMLDAFIFVTGVYGGTEIYWSIIKSDFVVRLVLSLFMGVVITFYLKSAKYSEGDRDKPQKVWDILDFRSALVKRVQGLEEKVAQETELTKQLKKSQEVYQLVLEGISAGVWEWDIKTGKQVWSDNLLRMLGYKKGSVQEDYTTFKSFINPDDLESFQNNLERHFINNSPFLLEFRVKKSDGSYIWVLGSGKAKLDDKGQPVKMVGSLVDINESKEAAFKLKNEFEKTEKLNKVLVDRELKMAEMKKQLKLATLNR